MEAEPASETSCFFNKNLDDRQSQKKKKILSVTFSHTVLSLFYLRLLMQTLRGRVWHFTHKFNPYPANVENMVSS
jgi:hypothetical protein